MLLDILFLLTGFGLLWGGGVCLVNGSVGLAHRLRITPAVIGLTVVSAGTSMPELMVSFAANWQGNPDLALGNVFGSNIFNVGLILGISSLVIVLPVERKTLRLEWPFLLLVTLVCIYLIQDGVISRVEGGLFVLVLAAFLWSMVKLARRDVGFSHSVEIETTTGSSRREWGLVLIGMVLLPLGGKLVVVGARDLAQQGGISERVIALTIVAMGTSLPELASSLVAASRGRTDIAVGNVIGSNLFNLLAVLGVCAVARPLAVNPEYLSGDVWWMLAFTVLLAPVFFFGRKVTRIDGALLLGVFVVYMWRLIVG